MQSKNVLLLGLLFVLLLTAFCVAKYIDQFYPNVQTIPTPKAEILENELELHPIDVEQIMHTQKIDEVDNDYIQVIKMVEQEERDIEEAYHQALLLEASKNRPKKRTPVIKQKEKIEYIKKVQIETVLQNKTLEGMGKLTQYEKQQLKEIASYKRLNPSAYLQIETKKRNKKVYMAKKYLTMLGILSKDIKIKNKHSKNSLISSLNQSEIEILLIKKD